MIGDIDGSEYKSIKQEYEDKIAALEGKLSGLKNETPDLSQIIPKAISNLENLHLKYQEGDILTKREIISSMYPENLVFDGEKYRTIRLNSVIGLLYSFKADFGQKKARKSVKNDTPPRWVTWERIELSTH
jgi:site-specific DNA recombinase